MWYVSLTVKLSYLWQVLTTNSLCSSVIACPWSVAFGLFSLSWIPYVKFFNFLFAKTLFPDMILSWQFGFYSGNVSKTSQIGTSGLHFIFFERRYNAAGLIETDTWRFWLSSLTISERSHFKATQTFKWIWYVHNVTEINIYICGEFLFPSSKSSKPIVTVDHTETGFLLLNRCIRKEKLKMQKMKISNHEKLGKYIDNYSNGSN